MPKYQNFSIDTLVKLAKAWSLPDTDENTFYEALYEAISVDNIERVRQALEAGVDPNHVNHEGCSLLVIAAICGSKNVIAYLLQEHNVTPDEIHQRATISPLHAAAQAGNTDVVIQFAEFVLKQGRRLNTQLTDSRGETPLLFALRHFNGDFAKSLVEKNLASPADSYEPKNQAQTTKLKLNSLGFILQILCTEAARKQQEADASKIGELENYAEYVIDKRKMNLFAKAEGVRAPVEYLQDYRHPDAKTPDEHLQKALVCIQNRSPKMYLRLLSQANDVPASSPLASFATRIKLVASKIETSANHIEITGPQM